MTKSNNFHMQYRNEFYTIIFFIALGLLSTILIVNPVYPIDDAYITLHNAKSFLTGEDRNYDNVSPLIGSTSLVHLLLVALSMPLVGSWASWLVCWICILLIVLGIFRLSADHKLNLLYSYLLIAIIFFNGFIWYHLLNGLETGLALASVIWLMIFSHDANPENIKRCGFLTGIAPFIRPELAALSGVIVIWMLDCCYAKGKIKEYKTYILCVLLGVIPFICFSFWKSGHALPLTIGAKRAYFAEDSLYILFKLDSVYYNIKSFLSQLGLFSLALFVLPFSVFGRALSLFVLVFYSAYMQFFPGALSHYGLRYQYLLLPLIVYGAIVALSSTHKTIRKTAVFLGLLTVAISIYSFKTNLTYISGNNFTKNELGGLVSWVKENIPADQVILIHDAGYISYYSDYSLVDFVGLKTPSAMNLHKTITSILGGKERIFAIESLAIKRNTHYLIMLEWWERIYKVAEGLEHLGWSVKMVRNGAYQVYKIDPPQTR